jgi:uncharacterized phage-associated protein
MVGALPKSQEEMMLSLFTFNEKTAVEAILYIVTHSRQPTFHRIAKLFYFADLCHLGRYGRFICGDSYLAMKQGPVPSGVYDMLKAVKNGLAYLRFQEHQKAFEVEGNHAIVPLRQPDLEWLSDSDIECLDEAIAEYDRYSFEHLTRLSQGDAWKCADENDQISLEAIVAQLGNPAGLLEHLSDPHP